VALEPIVPDWPAPERVGALMTTRAGGVSEGGCASLNLGMRCGDDPAAVAENRRRLAARLPTAPVWLKQVHGVAVADADAAREKGKGRGEEPEADAAVARSSGTVCAVLVADCMPVLLADEGGSVVGVAHAGWRGLCGGVIEATLDALRVPSASVMAWLGPAIGAKVYEVGDEVRAAFVARDARAAQAFVATRPGHWLLDLYAIARQRLAARGVSRVYGGDFCTYSDSERFFSFRRQGAASGRMAALLWLAG
jgi:YfiH family protein